MGVARRAFRRAADICFQRVSEPKQGKNRLHIDLDADDEEAEAGRVVALGATVLWRSTNPEDPFVTLADPDGNEFCVVRHPAGS